MCEVCGAAAASFAFAFTFAFFVLFLMKMYIFFADGAMLACSLRPDQFACPGDSSTCSCTGEEVGRLRWVAAPFVPMANPITFAASDPVQDSEIRGPFTAVLTSVSQVNPLVANLTSTLYVANVSQLGNDTIAIQCIDPGNAATANLSVEGKFNNVEGALFTLCYLPYCILCFTSTLDIYRAGIH